MTLPCRCDRGSSAYQIDGDCLAEGDRRRDGGEGGLPEKCLSTPPDTCLPVSDDMGDNIDNIKRNNCVCSSPLRSSPCRIKSMCHSM